MNRASSKGEFIVVNIDNLKIASLQVSIFTPAVLFSKTKVLERMIGNFADSFDGDTVAIPIPEDAPKEIPRIALHSADGKLKLDIAESRVNLFRYRKDNDVGIDTNQILDFSFRVIKEYKDCTQSIIGRLALVAVKFLRNEKAASTLASYFCKERFTKGLFDQAHDFEIHSHKKYTLEKFNVNSWVRCQTRRSAQDNQPIILVTQDINTLAEELETRDFSLKQVKAFLQVAHREQEQILCQYFPKKE